MHSTMTQLLWSTPARHVPSETYLGKPLYDPGHCTVTQFQGVTELLIASAIFVESNKFNSQILREVFIMRCHVEHPVVSMRELYSNNQILTVLKQTTQTCMVLSSRQNMNMANRTCVFAWINLFTHVELFSEDSKSLLLKSLSKFHFYSIVPWKYTLNWLPKCEVCTHFCEILYIYRDGKIPQFAW